MTRRPLPRILTGGGGQDDRGPSRGRELAGTAAHEALHPLVTLSRGTARLAAVVRQQWLATPRDRRGPLLFLVGACLLFIWLMPFGIVIAMAALIAVAAWMGRDRFAPEAATDDADDSAALETTPSDSRLRMLYESLVPYFTVDGDPRPAYAHGGDWHAVFSEEEFDDGGRLSALRIRYPAYFRDGEQAQRATVERVLHAKLGRGREYHFEWFEEENILWVRVLAPLPVDVTAQRFVTGPGEVLLGVTDPVSVQRTVPVKAGAAERDEPPVLWRTGMRSTAPHLLVLGQPGTGTTTLLRSLALQAVREGDVIVVDGAGSGEYACLAGRAGVLGVESGLSGAIAVLDWAARETERRLAGDPAAAATGARPRPLWLIVDRPAVLSHLAAADGRGDPQDLLRVPLTHGRPANVTVVVADQFDATDSLSAPVRSQTRARVVLGPATPHQVEAVLGAPPHTTPPTDVPPGRGYARLGETAPCRVQVPHTPNPLDPDTPEQLREAVSALLPDPSPSGV
ncbi:hypothetical protein [Streptomyces boninensis]|uniref:hypothetical protein n=1 Tax=Streptomyces boninensis TaxID=2039455 RepID=UPI003B213E39